MSRADPAVNTRRGTVEGGSGRTSELEIKELVAPYLPDTDTFLQGKTPIPPPFSSNSLLVAPLQGGTNRNQCLIDSPCFNLVSGIAGPNTNKLCDLYKGVETLTQQQVTISSGNEIETVSSG